MTLSQAITQARDHPRPSLSVRKTSDADGYSSSGSSASSAASIDTIRPSSREQPAPPSHWTNFFEQDLHLEDNTETQNSNYHVYLTSPRNPSKDPLFICHHGAGASGLSFAVCAREIRHRLPDAGILSLEARGHGSVVRDETGAEISEFSLNALARDTIAMIQLTAAKLGWTSLPNSILVGHSLGGAVMTTVAKEHFRAFGSNLIGYCVIDVVEGSAIEALGHMQKYLSSRPMSFASVEEAIQWHLRSRTIRDPRSADVSVPSLLIREPLNASNTLTWRTNLKMTSPWWQEWFQGMSQKFLTGRGAKLLILAGTDRLDKDLMIGQMQGKFQLVVLPEAGHFVQEDVPERTAQLLADFFKRNDRSQMVLPPKVSDLIAQGKKV